MSWGMWLLIAYLVWIGLESRRRAQLAREQDEPRCTRPPAGWVCTRNQGHKGPCAAWPIEDKNG